MPDILNSFYVELVLLQFIF